MLLENPLLQPLLILVQGQIPVLRLLQHGRRTRDGRFRIDELGRREVTTAFLALVAIGTLVMTVRALARHIAVGQELLRLLVVELCSRFLRQLPLIIEFAEPFGGKLMMRLRCCPAVYIERDAEFLEALLDHLMVAVHHILRGDTLLTGTNRDGHTMLIRTTDKQHLALLQSQVAHIDICRHIYTGQVTDMNTTIGVGQCRRHRRSLESLVLFHFYLFWVQRYKDFVNNRYISSPFCSLRYRFLWPLARYAVRVLAGRTQPRGHSRKKEGKACWS